MSYICETCNKVVPKNVPKRVKLLYRKSPSHKGDEISKEVAVCYSCFSGKDCESPEESNLIDNTYTPEINKPVLLCCDVCGESIGDEGQVTVDGVLCKQHLPTREKSKGRSRGKSDGKKSK